MVMDPRSAASPSTAPPPLPAPRHGGDPWNRVFSYHAFEPVLERAEGVYLYDKEGNRYIDASGGPIAMNIGHGDRRVVDAIRQAEKYALLLPSGTLQPTACRARAGSRPRARTG